MLYDIVTVTYVTKPVTVITHSHITYNHCNCYM